MAHIAIPAMMVGSSILSAKGQYDAGKAKEDAAKKEAAILDQNADAEYAKGTREAYDLARQTRIMMSDARAQQAGSGGTTTDPEAIRQLAEIQRDGEFNVMDAMFAGKVKKQDLEYQADVRRHEGKLAKKAAKVAAISTLLSGASSAFMGYKKLSPGAAPDAAAAVPYEKASTGIKDKIAMHRGYSRGGY